MNKLKKVQFMKTKGATVARVTIPKKYIEVLGITKDHPYVRVHLLSDSIELKPEIDLNR